MSRSADPGPRAATRPSPRVPAQTSAPSCDARTTQWWIAPLVSALIVTVFVLTYYPVARVQYRETRDMARLERELAALENRNERLSKQVARLRTPEGVEDLARTQLGLVKKGEHVVVVDGLPASAAQTETGPPRVDSDYVDAAGNGGWGAFLDFVFQVQ